MENVIRLRSNELRRDKEVKWKMLYVKCTPKS